MTIKPTNKQQRQFHIWLSATEHARIKAAAERSGLSMGSYVRLKALRAAQHDERKATEQATVSTEQSEVAQ